MEGKRIETELLMIRQSLKEQLDKVLCVSPVSLQAFKRIKEDFDYCNLLIRECRKRQVFAKIG